VSIAKAGAVSENRFPRLRAGTRKGDGDGERIRRPVASIEEARHRAVGIERLFIALNAETIAGCRSPAMRASL
jgi:hypothetical protein